MVQRVCAVMRLPGLYICMRACKHVFTCVCVCVWCVHACVCACDTLVNEHTSMCQAHNHPSLTILSLTSETYQTQENIDTVHAYRNKACAFIMCTHLHPHPRSCQCKAPLWGLQAYVVNLQSQTKLPAHKSAYRRNRPHTPIIYCVERLLSSLSMAPTNRCRA